MLLLLPHTHSSSSTPLLTLSFLLHTHPHISSFYSYQFIMLFLLPTPLSSTHTYPTPSPTPSYLPFSSLLRLNPLRSSWTDFLGGFLTPTPTPENCSILCCSLEPRPPIEISHIVFLFPSRSLSLSLLLLSHIHISFILTPLPPFPSSFSPYSPSLLLSLLFSYALTYPLPLLLPTFTPLSLPPFPLFSFLLPIFRLLTPNPKIGFVLPFP
jgi:hypothetical protein